MPLTVALTGARGEMGGILRRQLTKRGFRVIAIVRHMLPIVAPGTATDESIDYVAECRAADLTKKEEVEGLFEGCDAVIHLAALPKPWESYENIYKVNLSQDQLVLEEAIRSGARRFVYASTNHVMHGITMRTSPETLDSSSHGNHNTGYKLITLSDDPAPDSFYAVGKLHTENLGRYYARLNGLQFIGARIGWIVPEDDPRKSKWVSTDEHREYMRAMYLSHADCDEIFARCVERPLPDSTKQGTGNFALIYAVSNNHRRVFDLDETSELLGYTPQSDVDHFVAADWAHIGAPAATASV